MNSPCPTEKPNGICTCILDKCNCILAPKKKKNKNKIFVQNYFPFPLILNENKSNNIFLEENNTLFRSKRKHSDTIYS